MGSRGEIDRFLKEVVGPEPGNLELVRDAVMRKLRRRKWAGQDGMFAPRAGFFVLTFLLSAPFYILHALAYRNVVFGPELGPLLLWPSILLLSPGVIVLPALARNRAKLAPEQTGLEVVEGDVLDAAAVERAVPGHEAVPCAVGAPASDRRTLRKDATRNIIRAMETQGVETAGQIGGGDNKYLLFGRFLDVVTERATAEIEQHWTDRLAGVDVFAEDHVRKALIYVRWDD